ncbi:hypothetical protein PHSY_003246 [Pseudozyma hubeiensis SY62]|uniref:Uncharacterized protein n=1 Tax=Pseudozyma hubeiensis (strain SY62) TaxID=1305764 RepID=R9PC63_PSEHS|nr:hypothetical protein PHSY_003246 [Pseudozyma hubeiensis SY62]GAC95670.1 hypothetical protein PHSY_003246 [Pseudozyma hubeiensis SY62]
MPISRFRTYEHQYRNAADNPLPIMSAVYSIYTSPNHAPIPNHLPTLIVTPYGQPHHTLYSYIHTNFNKETYLLTPSPQGDLCVAKMVPPPGSRGGGASSDGGHSSGHGDKTVRCEASRNLKWSITNTGIHAPVYKLTLPNPDAPGHEQPLFQISKPNPNATWWSMFYFTYAGHLIPPKRIEFGKIQKNAAAGSGGGGGTRVTIAGKTPEEKAVWQTLGEGNEDMVEWIVLCAALNVLDDEIIKAAQGSEPRPSAPASKAVPSSRPAVGAVRGPNAGPPSKMGMPVPHPQGGINASYRGPNQSNAPLRGAPGGGPNPQMYQQQQQPPPQQRGPPPPQGYRGPPPAGQTMPMPQQGYAPPTQQARGPGAVPASNGRRF